MFTTWKDWFDDDIDFWLTNKIRVINEVSRVNEALNSRVKSDIKKLLSEKETEIKRIKEKFSGQEDILTMALERLEKRYSFRVDLLLKNLQ